MEKKIELECEYCGVEITEKDHKCPNCGANCTDVIKKYKVQKDAQQTEMSQKIAKDMEHAMKFPIIVIGLIFVVTAIIVFSSIHSFNSRSNENKDNDLIVEDTTEKKDEKIQVKYNETATAKDYNLLLDSYELYSYVSDNFPEHYNTPDGYQKIAFHFVYENTGDSAAYIGYRPVSLTADDYKVEDSDLKTGMFERAVQGQASYPEFGGATINEGEKIQGYVGFLVPKDKKILKFTYKKVIIEMDNPAFQG